MAEAQSVCPFMPTYAQSMSGNDVGKAVAIKARKFDKINHAGAVFRAANGYCDCGKMFRSHDPYAMGIPFHHHSLFHRLCLQPRRRHQKLHRKTMNEQSFLLEFRESYFGKSGIQTIQSDEDRVWRGIKEYEDVNIPRGERFPVESGRRCSADGIMLKVAIPDKLL